MNRQTEIRKRLREQYEMPAANEVLVAKLRHELSGLPHRHKLDKWAEWDQCVYCFYGTNWYTMALDDILAEVETSATYREEWYAGR